MENRNDILLERFFSREITPEERAELEERLAKDPALAESFAWQQQVARAFTVRENRRLKRLLQEEEAQFRPAAKRVRFSVRQWSAVAAVFLALVAAVWFLYPGKAPAPEDYFSAYPERYSSRGEETEQELAQAMQAYGNKDYAGAALALEKIYRTEPANPTAAFYLGVTYVGAGKYAEAIPVLEALTLQNENEDYQAAARWYIALARLGLGDPDGARTAAETYLAHPNNSAFRKQARALLEDL